MGGDEGAEEGAHKVMGPSGKGCIFVLDVISAHWVLRQINCLHQYLTEQRVLGPKYHPLHCFDGSLFISMVFCSILFQKTILCTHRSSSLVFLVAAQHRDLVFN